MPFPIDPKHWFERAALHEVLAVPGHANAAAGVGLALAAQHRRGREGCWDRAILWVRHRMVAMETGDPLGDGLATFAVDPGHVVFVRLQTSRDVLRAGLEGARCDALGAVVIEMKDAIDLTASRRLKLAAERSGVTLIMVRHSDVTIPNAAQIRWLVRAAPSGPSAWRRPTFDVTLLKHPAGLPERRWIVEWDRDRRQFSEALPRPVVADLFGRSLAA